MNTGNKSGIIRRLEKYLNKLLQWIICALHMIELCLRHLIISIDGNTRGPFIFSGPIGKKLESCENLKIVKYEVIPFKCDVQTTDSRVYSSDQKYLHDICISISNGVCDDKVAKRSPGKMNHARWLTTGNRILRLYVSTSKPSNNLLI